MCLVTLVLIISLQFLLHILHRQPLANCSKVISLKIMKFSEGSKGLISGSTSSLNYHMLKSIYCLNVACSTFLFFMQLDPCINAEVLQFYIEKRSLRSVMETHFKNTQENFAQTDQLSKSTLNINSQGGLLEVQIIFIARCYHYSCCVERIVSQNKIGSGS